MIFHHALRELDALPDEALFIDDLRENVLAAASLGIHGFQFTTPEDLLAELSGLGM
jgi:HAD superfamily hydrolase (TIGR01509 family)